MSLEVPAPPRNASDPHATFVNSSCIDFLLIEMVPLANRTANDLLTTGKQGEGGPDEDEQREAASRRLDALGYRVGQGLVERYVKFYKEEEW